MSRQVPVPVEYKGLIVPEAYSADLIVNGQVIAELKAVDTLHPVHEAQLMTYLRLLRKPLGILINFHTAKILEGGFKRIALRPRS